VPLDEPQRLLDRALLMRADREPEVAGVDLLLIGGERDPRAGFRNAFDADCDVQVSS
jgi:hypothetical protein